MNKSKNEIEEGLEFSPKFNDKGLVPCITTSAGDGKVLMFAWMNEEALVKSLETGQAHYWSRSRNELWHKGATSGNYQEITEMRTDCDQDCIWITVEMSQSASCHTGRESCFYRKVSIGYDGQPILNFKDSDRLFDPEEIYSQ